jgi:class 3 adenylate cyclase/tetratricopeptide (TPR) repeat protein
VPATERRVVTVLFGDLSDFTAWAEDLDPERVGAVTDRVMAALAGAVKTFGGHVDKLTGDGIMAVFGAPVAHEDDAERAIRAALSMQRAVRRVLDDERGGGAPLGLRVGLNTGPVVAGVQAALEYTVIGDTVNTASRLADAAAVGAVYAGERTSVATRHLASWRRLRPLRLKGKREPVEAYELLGLLDAPGTRSGLGDEAPFVGRETELARVASRLAEVVDRGEPRVLIVTGEAGLGKTRFAAEVERFVARSDIGSRQPQVFAVRCAAFGELRRLAPLADLVRIAIGLPDDLSVARSSHVIGHASHSEYAFVEERLRRLAARLARAAPDLPPVNIEMLVTLLGYGEPTGSALAGGEPEQLDLEAIPAAVADLLTGLAAETPMLVMVDDLHDASPESVDALGAMLSRLTGPVLVLLYGRPELVRTAGVLTRIADAEVTTLPALRGADTARLLGYYLAGGRLPQPDEDRLLSTAQGNPFYLAELVTLLLERGALTTGSGRGAPLSAGSGRGAPLSAGSGRGAPLSAGSGRGAPLSAGSGRGAPLSAGSGRGAPLSAGSGRGLAVSSELTGWVLAPGSLSGRLLSRDLAAVLAARIDALPPDARSVLRDAAVVGDVVPAGALAVLRERRDARPVAVAALELERALDELFQRRMLHRMRGGYAFATPLLREAAYAGIGKADLADRHAALARWAASGAGSLASAAMSGTSSAEAADTFIAEHVERAAALADAVGLRPEAEPRAVAPLGVAALGRSARRALAGGEPAQAVQYAERAATLAGDTLSLPDELVYARSLLQLGRAPEALRQAEKIIANAAENAGIRAGALLTAGRAYRLMGDLSRSYASWLEALAASQSAGIPGTQGEALRRLGMADFLAGRLAQAGSRLDHAYQIAVVAQDSRSQAWSLQNLAWVTTTRGDFSGADATLGRAARLFAEQHDPIGRAWLRGTTAFARLLAGRLTEARRLARIFLPFGERVGEQWAVGTLRAVEAFASAELGELDEADRGARRAYRDFAAASDDWGRGFALVVRGAIARGLGSLEHARDLLTDALTYGEKTGHPLLIGMARTIRGFVDLDRGDPAAAEANAQAVLAVVEPHNVLEPAQVGPCVLLGAARLGAGDIDAALRILEPVATHPTGVALLFPRRQGIALYAQALRCAGRTEEALGYARQAAAMPGEDIRSRVVALRELASTLAANRARDEAGSVAAEAVRVAYSSPQVCERAASDALVESLAALAST